MPVGLFLQLSPRAVRVVALRTDLFSGAAEFALLSTPGVTQAGQVEYLCVDGYVGVGKSAVVVVLLMSHGGARWVWDDSRRVASRRGSLA